MGQDLAASSPAQQGSLVVVGTGMRAGSQLTPEARHAIMNADVVHYLVADPVSETLITETAARASDLADLYDPERERVDTYRMMTERVAGDLRRGLQVCVALYGHPGVFVDPSHDMMTIARAEGHEARMLPGISAAAALFADLDLDPGRDGIQMYAATDFLVRRRTIDPTVPLVLWQVGAVGESRGVARAATEHLPVLVERLSELYPAAHEVILYEAAGLTGFDPRIDRVAISAIPTADITRAMTLVVPPFQVADEDPAMVERLGLGHVTRR